MPMTSWWDPELKPNEWFDVEINTPKWFDREMDEPDTAVVYVPRYPAVNHTATAVV